MQQVTAFVLAGGQSVRMGRDKASLVLAGRTLLTRAIEIARAAGGAVFVIGSGASLQAVAREAGVSTVEDAFAGQGPLAGIHAALKVSSTDLNFIMAVDMPFVTPGLIQYLVQRAARTEALVVVPRTGKHLHPLCAVYRRAFAAIAEPALVAGNNKIDALFSSTAVEHVREDELTNAGFVVSIFDNVNSPEDFARAQARLLG